VTSLLKLGGSLLTDKSVNEGLRQEELQRIVGEIQQVLTTSDGTGASRRRVLVGHGSGSFGHVVAERFQAHLGKSGPHAKTGFALVARSAAKLNAIVLDALVSSGLPCVAFPPRSSVVCADGVAVQMRDFAAAVRLALDDGVVPLVNGDCVADSVRGCTILSTEGVFAGLLDDAVFAADATNDPFWILCAGETNGVLAKNGDTVPVISEADFDSLDALTSASRGADVSGAMRGKVRWLLDLVTRHRRVRALIFNGLTPGNIALSLRAPQEVQHATRIVSASDSTE
jgi:isopentenyl phosphate kinase